MADTRTASTVDRRKKTSTPALPLRPSASEKERMVEGILKNAAARRKARADDPSSIVTFCRDDSNPRIKKA
jgi:hypothetical protein